jgi:penicillin-binding protein 2
MAFVETRRRTETRLIALQVASIVVFAFLGVCFWVVQVNQHAKYEEMAENQHQRTLSLRAPRGMLYDRNGELLVENRKAYTISVVREHSKDLDRTVRLLGEVAGVELEQIQAALERYKGKPSFEPVPVIEDASLAQVAAITARRLDFELPELVVEEVPTRLYPADGLAAHLFGYVGQASEAQVVDGLPSGSIVGQNGIERIYNRTLMGQDGTRRVVVNNVGRQISTIDEVPPVRGPRVELTIDLDLQQAAENAFRQAGFNGAALFMDPRNGEILSYTSLPAYDPNDFAHGIDTATWRSLNSDPLRPLQNRVIQGRYPPGSTFKIVVAVAALEEGLITPDHRISCNGGATFYGRRYRCHLAGGHGSMDLRHALEKSCNVYFYTLGQMLGVDKIYEWADKLGLAGKTGIDLPSEEESIVPNTAWKLKRTGEPWYPGETISVAIGQGQNTVTPASLAVMISTVANGGTRVTPHVVKAVDDGDGFFTPAPLPEMDTTARFKPETLQAVREGLWMVVNAQGTGGRARIQGYDVAGKTGTAQVISNEGRARAQGSSRDLRDHGWFVFFAPRDNPEIAGVVFGEHSEHDYLAAPIAKHVMETYFAKKEGRPLPSLTPPRPPAPAPVAPPPVPVEPAADPPASVVAANVPEIDPDVIQIQVP